MEKRVKKNKKKYNVIIWWCDKKRDRENKMFDCAYKYRGVYLSLLSI